jgi:hypothetical protein
MRLINASNPIATATMSRKLKIDTQFTVLSFVDPDRLPCGQGHVSVAGARDPQSRRDAEAAATDP